MTAKILIAVVAAAMLAQPASGDNRWGETPRHDAVTDAGAEIEYDEPEPDQLPPAHLADPYQTYTYEMMMEHITQFEAMYPDFFRCEIIGQSAKGRDVPMMILGTGPQKVFWEAGAHAREHITTNYIMYMTDQYAYAYAMGEAYGEADIKTLLRKVTFYMVPMTNPDGVTMAQTDPSLAAWKANANGVDLNSNYPFAWQDRKNKAKVKSPGPQLFGGYTAASEPETQNILGVVNSHTFAACISLHIAGEVIYWDDINYETATRQKALTLANVISQSTGYAKMGRTPKSDITYGGGFAEYTRAVLQVPSFTVELCQRVKEWPCPADRFARAWEKAGRLGIAVAQAVAG